MDPFIELILRLILLLVFFKLWVLGHSELRTLQRKNACKKAEQQWEELVARFPALGKKHSVLDLTFVDGNKYRKILNCGREGFIYRFTREAGFNGYNSGVDCWVYVGYLYFYLSSVDEYRR